MRDRTTDSTQLFVFASLLAACSNAAEPSASLVTSPAFALHRAVRPGQPAELSIEVEPFASCVLRASNEAGDTNGLRLVSDQRGILRVHVTRNVSAVRADQFSLSCETGGQPVLRSLEVTSDLSSPTLPSVSRTMPYGGTLRAALTGDLQRFTQQELRALHFPPRPDAAENPAAYERWRRMVGRDSMLVEPEPVASKGQYNGNAEDHTAGFAAKTTGAAYTHVLGQWTVPTVTSSGTSDQALSSIWVGLDGLDGSEDILQNGTRQDVMPSGPNVFVSYYAWSEYFPDSETRLSNFPVYPGDTILCETWIGDTNGNETPSGTVAWFYFDDLTAGFATYDSRYPSATTPAFTGASAEWIVERPGLSYYPYPLAKFSPFTMSFAEASDTAHGNHGFLDVGPVEQIDMINNGSPLSLAVAEASYGGDRESIDFRWFAAQ